MKEKLLTRRNLIKTAVVAAVGSTDIGWSAHAFSPSHEVDEQGLVLISNKYRSIKKELSFTGFDKNFHIGGETMRAKPNADAFSQTLLQLAYVDGGVQEVYDVIRYIRDYGLRIKLGGESAMAAASYKARWIKHKVPEIELGSDVVTQYATDDLNDDIIFHEMYHFLQQARNPTSHAALTVGTDVASVGSILYLFHKGEKLAEKIATKMKKPITRRPTKLIGAVALAAGSYGVVDMVTPLVDPMETQAYGENARLLIDRSLDNRRGTLFDFEHIS